MLGPGVLVYASSAVKGLSEGAFKKVGPANKVLSFLRPWPCHMTHWRLV